MNACRALLFLALLPLAAMLPAQLRPTPVVPPPDPWLATVADAQQRLGYVSFGPFVMGHNHGSDDLHLLLPDEPLRWIETAHFRIGCALPGCAVTGGKPWLQTLQGELQQLAARLPSLDPKTRHLDGWLRAHLVAQRAERLYQQVQTLLEVDDAWFPAAPGNDPAYAAQFRGVGPFLGMRHKFTILLLNRGENLAKFTAAFHARATTEPARRHDGEYGCLVFAAAGDTGAHLADDEEALAALLTFHLTHNLLTGFRAFGHELPAWLVQGLALHFGRQVSAQVPLVAVNDDADRARYRQWDKRLAVMKKEQSFVPFAQLIERVDIERLGEDAQLQSLAMVEWLRERHAGGLARFLHRMKEPFHGRLRFPTNQELYARQADALREAFGMDADALDRQWRQQLAPRRLAKR